MTTTTNTQSVQQRQTTPMTLQGLLQRHRDSIEAALPRHMSADRLLRIALTEVRKNQDLALCEPLSFIGSVVQAAQLGLEPGSALGHAYLVPFKNKDTGRKEVQLIIGYRGMIDLARRSGQIISITAHAVYDGDEFEYKLGLQESLHHVPARERVAKERRMIAVYAIARLQSGHQMEVMTRDEIEGIRKRSKAANFGPWATDYEEMAKKTVIRRLFKLLPVSIEIQRAVALDETASIGQSQRNDLLMFDPTVETGGAEAASEQVAFLNNKFAADAEART